MSQVNIFIILNMGCEMLYVVDQRLKAQLVATEKSILVMRDISCYLLEPEFLCKLLDRSPQEQIITVEECKATLNSIACSSLMRLDETSMNKLWDLMTMVFKWQLSLSKSPQSLLDITFNHLDGAAKIYPDVRKTALFDYTKNRIIDLWSSLDETEQRNLYENILRWYEPFNTKISALLRLGLQRSDGSFYTEQTDELFQSFTKSLGYNIYVQSEELKAENELKHAQLLQSTSFSLASQLHNNESRKSIAVSKNILLDDIGIGLISENPLFEGTSHQTEFVQVNPVHTISTSWENFLGSQSNATLKTILDTDK